MAMNKLCSINVQVEAKMALSKMLEHLARFAVDSGLSVADLNSILRVAVVKSIGSQQVEIGGRTNVSIIAASTGIPRGEVSKILKKSNGSLDTSRIQLPTNKILAAWCDDPKFSTPSGHPSDLKIFGRGSTFETLVKKHGRGIPTRAILEELARVGAIKVRNSQMVSLKSLIAFDRKMTPNRIKSFGKHGSKVLSFLLEELRFPGKTTSLFRQLRLNASPGAVKEHRTQISSMSNKFLTDINCLLGETVVITKSNLLTRSQLTNRGIVAVYIHEDVTNSKANPRVLVRRKNFRRSP
jgi:Family of unknown function (DUF6502)